MRKLRDLDRRLQNKIKNAINVNNCLKNKMVGLLAVLTKKKKKKAALDSDQTSIQHNRQ
jgi:hypothetical protein